MDKQNETRGYDAPTIVDYGNLRDLTQNDNVPSFVDVPQGTPVGQGPIVGSDPNFS
jgi:hypothetical protein